MISYALEDKPDQRGERYVMASGVGGMLVSVAKHQMRDVRRKWAKDKPGAFVQAYHVIQSFARDELDPEQPDSWMTAQKLGRALAEERFPGRQVLVVTQRDGRTGCVHNHLVANSIETKSGRSLNSAVVTHARLVEAHERVLDKQGFAQRADLKQAFSDAKERQERGEPSSLRRAGSNANSELREFQQHILWETDCDLADEFGGPRKKEPFSLTVLRHSIEMTLEDPAVVDWDSFVEVGRSRGVQIEQRGKKGRGISYGMLREEPDGTRAEPAASDRRRCTTLGTAYEMGAVEAAFVRNGIASIATARAGQTKNAQTAKQRMLMALAEASAEGDDLAQRMIAEHRAQRPTVIDEQPESMAALETDPQDAISPSCTAVTVLDESRQASRNEDEVNSLTDGLTAAAESQPSPIKTVREEAGGAARKVRSLHTRFPELFDAERPAGQDTHHYGLE